MPRSHTVGRFSRPAEWLLWTTAALCLSSVAIVGAHAAAAHSEAQQIASSATPPNADLTQQSRSSPASPATVQTASGTVIGRLEIPDLHLSVPITTGVDSASLQRGVGHINGTAMPGGLGTLGLAGHRDTYLRALRDVTLGMDIRVVDVTGVYHYTVDSTEVVTPEQVNVLDIQSRPELTLITCFPFNYIGAAPKRFIVHAHLNSVAPDQRS